MRCIQICLSIMFLCGTSLAGETIQVGMLSDGQWGRFDWAPSQIQIEFDRLMGKDGTLNFTNESVAGNISNPEDIDRKLNELFSDDSIDMVMGFGAVTLNRLMAYDSLPKPVVITYPFELSPVLLTAMKKVRNLHCIAFYPHMKRHVALLKKVAGSSRVAVIIDPESMGNGSILNPLIERARVDLDLDISLFAAGTAEEALMRLDGVNGVYLTALATWSDSEVQKFADGLKQKGIASISQLGEGDVVKGALLGIHGGGLTKLSRRIALDIQRILSGEAPESLPQLFYPQEKPSINLGTAQALGISPDWDTLLTFHVIENPEESRELNIGDVIREGLSGNLDLLNKHRETALQQENQKTSKSVFRPQVTLTASGRKIDEERANFLNPEQTFSAEVSATQLLFSENARANRDIQGVLVDTKKLEAKQEELDLTAALIHGYLEVVSAETNMGIIRKNLNITRSHLDFAEASEKFGVTNSGDIYRWESRLAEDTQRLIEALSNLQAKQFKLNRMMNRKVDSPLNLKIPDLSVYGSSESSQQLQKMLQTPRSLNLFLSFLIEESRLNAPALAALDSAIQIQERALTATRRAFYLPDIQAKASAYSMLHESGKGADVEIPDLGITSDTDTGYSIGLKLSFSPYRGGSKRSEHRKAGIELNKLQTELQSLKAKYDQAIYSAGHLAAGSFVRIAQAESGLVAAEKNYELVKDGYRLGKYSIIQVLDAQNNALKANQNKSGSIFRFLTDLATLEHATGKFQMLGSEGQIESFLQRYRSWLEARSPIKSNENL